MKRLLILNSLFLSCLFLSNIIAADVPVDQVGEVSNLLKFVKDSGCVINRNGTDHPADKGISHIQKKYDYFRDDIKSTEDFIKYSATKSTMSGDYYTVTCSGKETIRTHDWLMSELKRFRTENK